MSDPIASTPWRTTGLPGHSTESSALSGVLDEPGGLTTVAFTELIEAAQSDGPDEALDAVRGWIGRLPAHAELAVKLRLVEVIALLFGRRLPEAIDAASRAAEVARAAGMPWWEADAIGQRGLAHWESGDRAAAGDDMIAVETMIDAGGGGRLWDGARNSLGSGYVECGYFEMAVEHYAVAALSEVTALAGTPGNVVDAMNLGWLYLRWTFDDQRAGEVNPDDPSYAERVGQSQRWYQVALDRAGGPEHRWYGEIVAGLALARACLDPAGHIDELAGLIPAQADIDTENDQILQIVRYASLLRRLGRAQQSLQVSTALLAAVDGPVIWQSTIREVLHEVHQGQLALGVAGAAESAACLNGLLRRLWQQNALSMAAFRVRRDLAILAERERETARLAHQDALTGLDNRRAMQQWQREHPVGPAVVAMIDLDGFKQINDTHGHPVGDQILIRAGAALRSLDPDACLTRYGGDEFVLLTEDLRARTRLPSAILAALAAIDMAPLGRGEVLTATVGIATATAGMSTDGLLDRADAELMASKRANTPHPADGDAPPLAGDGGASAR